MRILQKLENLIINYWAHRPNGRCAISLCVYVILVTKIMYNNLRWKGGFAFGRKMPEIFWSFLHNRANFEDKWKAFRSVFQSISPDGSRRSIKTESPSERLLLQRGRRSFFSLPIKNLKIRGKIRKNSAKRKWKEKSSKPKKNSRKHPAKWHPLFRVSRRTFWKAERIFQITLPKSQKISQLISRRGA